MRRLTIGMVAEGPTDILLLRALIDEFAKATDDCFENLPYYKILQPEESATTGFGDYGGGWRGVTRWCQNFIKSFPDEVLFKGPQLDLLIIHLDADVAREAEINCARPCPPAQETCEALGQKIITWLGISNMAKLVLGIPADNLEAWVLAAYDPQTFYHQPPAMPLECVPKPDLIISNQSYKPRPLLKRKEGKPKKSKREYENLIPVVLTHWTEVKNLCPQAAKFEQEVRIALK